MTYDTKLEQAAARLVADTAEHVDSLSRLAHLGRTRRRERVLAVVAVPVVGVLLFAIPFLMLRGDQAALDPASPATVSDLPETVKPGNSTPLGSPDPIDDTRGVAVDGDTLWAATGAGVIRWDLPNRTSQLLQLPGDVPTDPGTGAQQVAVAPDGTVRVATSEVDDELADQVTFSVGLLRLDGTEWVQPDGFGDLGVGGQITAMAVGPDGTLFAAIGTDALVTFDGVGWAVTPVPSQARGVAGDDIGWAFDMAVAPDGTLWAAGLDDVLAHDGASWQRFTAANGIPTGYVGSLEIAPSGDVWVTAIDSPLDVTAANGVGRYDGRSWTVYDVTRGLASQQATAVAAGPDGTVWVVHTPATGGNSDVRAAGTLSRFDGYSWATTEITNVGHGFGQGGATVDESGTLWVSSRWGIVEFDGATATAWWVGDEGRPVVEVASTVVPGGTEIPATTAARPAATASCPAGSQPDQPGPIDQERPAAGFIAAAAFDSQSGLLVLVSEETGATWVFDVCSNTWAPTAPTAGARTLVYDVDSDRVVAFSSFDGAPAAYDSDTGTWVPSAKSHPATRITQAVYDPVSGLIIARSSVTSEMWAYDVDSDDWTHIYQGPESAPTDSWTQIMVYDPGVDRIVLYAGDNNVGPSRWEGAGTDTTWEFDLRALAWSIVETTTPELRHLLLYGTYDESAGLVVIPEDGAMTAYDATTREWRVLWVNDEDIGSFGLGVGPHNRNDPWVAYDPINERVLVGGGAVRMVDENGAVRWVDDPDDVWAFDTRTATWLELVPGTY